MSLIFSPTSSAIFSARVRDFWIALFERPVYSAVSLSKPFLILRPFSAAVLAFFVGGVFCATNGCFRVKQLLPSLFAGNYGDRNYQGITWTVSRFSWPRRLGDEWSSGSMNSAHETVRTDVRHSPPGTKLGYMAVSDARILAPMCTNPNSMASRCRRARRLSWVRFFPHQRSVVRQTARRRCRR